MLSISLESAIVELANLALEPCDRKRALIVPVEISLMWSGSPTAARRYASFFFYRATTFTTVGKKEGEVRHLQLPQDKSDEWDLLAFDGPGNWEESVHTLLAQLHANLCADVGPSVPTWTMNVESRFLRPPKVVFVQDVLHWPDTKMIRVTYGHSDIRVLGKTS